VQIQEKLNQITKLKTQLEEKLSLQNQLQNQLEKTISQIKDFEKQKAKLEKQIQAFDEKKLQNLKSNKQNLQSQLQNLEKQILHPTLIQNFQQISHIINLPANLDVHQVKSLIEKVISEWKTLAAQKQSIQTQIQNLENEFKILQTELENRQIKPWTIAYEKIQNQLNQEKNKIQSQIDKINYEIEKQIQIQNQLKAQLQNLEKQINQLNQTFAKQTDFHCQLIDKKCPFVEKIKWDSLNQLKTQLQTLQEEKKQLIKQLEEISQVITSLQKDKQQTEALLKNIKIEKLPIYAEIQKKQNQLQKKLQQFNFEEKQNQLQNQLKTIQKNIDLLRKFLIDINYKEILDYYNQYQQIQSQINEIEKQISQLEKLSNQIDQYRQELATTAGQIQSLEKQKSQLQSQLEQVQIQIKDLEKQIKEKNENRLLEQKQILEQINQLLAKLLDLIDEYQNAKLQIQALKEKEKIYQNLQNILWKELMIVVLQEFLPLLEQAINALLGRAVDFTISFQPIETKSWKLELEIYVEDDKGIRPIKSLSGGQKTVLKLAWILAVSGIMKNKFLFLDETINNLDFDSVWKVAKMIEDFVKKNDLKFYVVSHSQQIQQMNIWDQIIEI